MTRGALPSPATARPAVAPAKASRASSSPLRTSTGTPAAALSRASSASRPGASRSAAVATTRSAAMSLARAVSACSATASAIASALSAGMPLRRSAAVRRTNARWAATSTSAPGRSGSGSATSSRVVFEPMSITAQRARGLEVSVIVLSCEARPRAATSHSLSRSRCLNEGVAATVPAILVRDLRKSYGGFQAVRGIDFEVAQGEVFGLLGPNGAGKTTTVEILEGYRDRDGGQVSVLGHDPQRPGPEFRERIGVVLQQSDLWPNLTVREVHRAFAGYYARPRNVDEVIELVGLAEKTDARVKTLSGGQKRRLDLGVALVGDPDLVFLDEPTTGFDPQARRAAWEIIRSLRSLGKTVLLTTHYLDEAEQLAD